MSRRIEDYALIGDCHTAAARGSRRVTGLALFSSVRLAGLFRRSAWHRRARPLVAGPVGSSSATTRTYRGDSTGSRDDVHDRDGRGDGGRRHAGPLRPAGRSCGWWSGVGAQIRMRTHFAPRFDYGSLTPWIRPEAGGVVVVGGPDTPSPSLAGPLGNRRVGGGGRVRGQGGRAGSLVLRWHPSHERLSSPIDAAKAMDETARLWQEWADRCNYQGEWRDAVVRSSSHSRARRDIPTGGIVAAPTTLIAGADRRAAELGLPLLLAAGRHVHPHGPPAVRVPPTRRRPGESGCSGRWPARGRNCTSCTGSPVSGGCRRWNCPGCRASRAPARCGLEMGRYNQFQLDVFGETLDCLHLARHYGLTRRGRRLADRKGIARPSGTGVDGAGRRDLGGPRPEAALHPFQVDGRGWRSTGR